MNRHFKVLALGFAVSLAATSLFAAELDWIKDGGNMNDTDGWSSTPNLPAAGDWLFVDNGTMNITGNFLGGVPTYLYVGRLYNAHTGPGGTVVQTGGDIVLDGGMRGVGRAGGTGTYTMQGGTLTLNGNTGGSAPLLIGQDSGSVGTMTLWNNSQVTIAGEGDIGNGGNGTLTLHNTSKFTLSTLALFGGATFDINDTASVTASSMSVSSNATVNDSASLTASSLTINTNGTLNLNGASTLSTAGVSFGLYGMINIDGGTINATASNANFILGDGLVNILAGGATIDTNGCNIATGVPLLAGTISGGLTKKGLGTLTLGGANTYTGATTIIAGGIQLVNDSPIAGNLTVPAGCSFGGQGSLGGILTTANNSTLKFYNSTDKLSLGAPPVINSTTIVEAHYADPASAPASWTVMQWTKVAGEANPLPHMALPVDSVGIKALSLAYGADSVDSSKSDVNMIATTITNEWSGPTSGNNYSTAGNWTNHVPSGGGEIALFGTVGTAGAVNVDSPRTLSSLIFNNGGSYALSGGQITLNSTAAMNSQITVLQGTHTMSDNLALSKNTLVHVYDAGAIGNSLTIAGAISGSGNLTLDGEGKMVLAGANTFTGKTILNSGTLEVTTLGNVAVPNTLGQSSAASANFVLGGGSLHYTGPDGGSTDRGITIAADTTILLDHDATFAGQFAAAAGASGAMLAKLGVGKMTFNYTGGTNEFCQLQIREGECSFADNTITKIPNLQVGTGHTGDVGKLSLEGNASCTVASVVSAGSWSTSGTVIMNGSSSLTAVYCEWGAHGRAGTDSLTASMSGTSHITTTAGGMWFGYQGDACTMNMNLGEPTGAAKIDTGFLDLGHYSAPTTWSMYGHSSVSGTTLNIGFGSSGELNAGCAVTLNDYASMSASSAFQLGFGPVDSSKSLTMNLTSHASLTCTGTLVDIGQAWGGDPNAIMTISDHATFTSTGAEFILGHWGGHGTLNIRNQAAVNVSGNSMEVGRDGGIGLLDIQGGTVQHQGMAAAGNILVGLWAASGIINVGQSTDPTPIPGLLSTDNLMYLGYGGGSDAGVGTTGKGTLNIKIGGTVAALGIGSTGSVADGIGDGTVNFDGGTLKAIANNPKFIAVNPESLPGTATLVANVLAGGAIIDTQSYAVSVTVPLVSGVVAGTDGGLIKEGAGALTLTVDPTYNGNTTVNVGTLNVGNLSTPGAAVYVATGATLTAASITADTLTIGGAPKAVLSATTVPEPSSLVLLALAGLGALLAWRRK